MVKDIQYVTDAEGRRTSVLLPIDQYEALRELRENYHLAQAACESLTDEERIPWEQVKAELVTEGRLDAGA